MACDSNFQVIVDAGAAVQIRRRAEFRASPWRNGGGVTHEAMQLLMACRWRGNVRELDNALQRAVILGEGPLVTPADLPPDLAPVEGDPALVDVLDLAVERFKKQHIERILRQTTDKKEAAQRLGIGLTSLYRHIADLAIQTQE